jgi:hypothetical protein
VQFLSKIKIGIKNEAQMSWPEAKKNHRKNGGFDEQL